MVAVVAVVAVSALPVTAPVRGPTKPAAVATPADPTEYATPT